MPKGIPNRKYTPEFKKLVYVCDSQGTAVFLNSLFRSIQHLASVIAIGSGALYACPWFDACFTEPYWEAYLFCACKTGKVPEFRMVRACREEGYSIAEFMVLPPRRRRRLNRAAAEACFRLHPDRREVSPSLGDSSAYRFRERVLPAGQGKRRSLREMFLPFVQIPR